MREKENAEIKSLSYDVSCPGNQTKFPTTHFLALFGFYLSDSDLSLDVGDSAFFPYSHELGLYLYLVGRNFLFQLGCVQNKET